MKTIIYLRTSTEMQNPENQLRDCKKIAKFGEYEIVKEFQSAYKDKDRPKFDYIKKQISYKKVEHLICWDLDRLFRDRKKLIAFFKFCQNYNCKIHSYRQEWLESLNDIQEPFNEIMHDLMLNIMGWLSEDESKKKSDRVKIAYKNSTKKWGRKPIKNKTIKEVLTLHNQGRTLREIASEVYYWDDNRNKHQISKSAVHLIIKENKGETS